MILIEKQCLSDGVEATKRERQLIEELKPSLNSVIHLELKRRKRKLSNNRLMTTGRALKHTNIIGR